MKIGIKRNVVDLSETRIRVGTDVLIPKTAARGDTAGGSPLRFARRGGCIDQRDRLGRCRHRVEVVQDPRDDGSVVLANACFNRGFVVSEHIVDNAEPRRPVLETSQSLDGAAIDLWEITRPNESSGWSALSVDLSRIILPSQAGSDR